MCGAGVAQGTRNPGKHDCDVDTTLGMGLWIEKNLCMSYVIGVCSGDIGCRHVIKVLFGTQHIGASVVEVQK